MPSSDERATCAHCGHVWLGPDGWNYRPTCPSCQFHKHWSRPDGSCVKCEKGEKPCASDSPAPGKG